MTIQGISDQVANFYDLESETAKSKVIDSVKTISNSMNTKDFIEEIREIFVQDQLSGIGVIYEALSDNPEKWGEFFFEEIQRAFRNAETSKEPYKILDSLEFISMTDKKRIEERSQIISFLANYLDHSNETIRYKSIWYLGDWIDIENVNQYSRIIENVQEILRSDSWRIQLVSKRFLEELNRLPNNYRMNFADKLKAKFLNEFNMK